MVRRLVSSVLAWQSWYKCTRHSTDLLKYPDLKKYVIFESFTFDHRDQMEGNLDNPEFVGIIYECLNIDCHQSEVRVFCQMA